MNKATLTPLSSLDATHRAPATEPKLPVAAQNVSQLWPQKIPKTLTKDDSRILARFHATKKPQDVPDHVETPTHKDAAQEPPIPPFDSPFLNTFQETAVEFLQAFVTAQLQRPREELSETLFALGMKVAGGVDQEIIKGLGWKDLDPYNPSHERLINTLLSYLSENLDDAAKIRLVQQFVPSQSSELTASDCLPLTCRSFTLGLKLNQKDAKETLNKVLDALFVSEKDRFTEKFAKVFSQMTLDHFQPTQPNQTTMWQPLITEIVKAASEPVIHRFLELLQGLPLKNIFDMGAQDLNNHIDAITKSYQAAKAAPPKTESSKLYEIFENTFKAQKGCHSITAAMITAMHPEPPVSPSAQATPTLNPIRSLFFKKLTETFVQELASPKVRDQVLQNIFARKDELLKLVDNDLTIKSLLSVFLKDQTTFKFFFDTLWDRSEKTILDMVKDKVQNYVVSRIASPDELSLLLYSQLLPSVTEFLGEQLCKNVLEGNLKMTSPDTPNETLKLLLAYVTKDTDDENELTALAVPLQKLILSATPNSKELLALPLSPTDISPIVRTALTEFKAEVRKSSLPYSTPQELLDFVQKTATPQDNDKVPAYGILVKNMIALGQLSSLVEGALNLDVVQTELSKILVRSLAKVRTSPEAYQTLSNPLLNKLKSLKQPEEMRKLVQDPHILPDENDRNYGMLKGWERVSRVIYDLILYSAKDSTAKTLALKVVLGTDHSRLQSCINTIYTKLLKDQLLNENAIYLFLDLLKVNLNPEAEE